MEKTKDRYCKKEAAKYYLKDKKAIKEKSKNRQKNLSKEGKKTRLKSIKEKDISN